MSTFDDKPLAVQFPELNSFQISKLREMLKAEYERGQIDENEWWRSFYIDSLDSVDAVKTKDLVSGFTFKLNQLKKGTK